jgi:hypothetical protein
MNHRDGPKQPADGGLGRKIDRKPEKAEPKLEPTGTPGVFRNSETGHLETHLPLSQSP